MSSSALWDRKNEALSSSDLLKLQTQRLKALVARVYTSNQYYKKRLDGAKVTPTSISSV